MNAKQFAFVVGIAVLFAIVIGLGIDAFYASPKYENFCNNTGEYQAYPEKFLPVQNCSVNYSQYNEMIAECNAKGGFIDYKYNSQGCSIPDKCNMCGKEFQDIQNIYNRNVFYIAFTIGIAAVISGLIITEILGAGLMFGGILTSIYGIMRYFSELGKIARFLVVLVGFLILIFVGRKKVNDIQARARKISKRKR
ncbi:MAG: hypothetical protein V1886_00250 [archaeon]